MIFGIAGVACGAVVKSKLTGPVGATVGLWAAYVRITECSNIICIEVIVGRTTVIISFIITNTISFHSSAITIINYIFVIMNHIIPVNNRIILFVMLKI